MSDANKLRSIELFVGAGGLALGTARAGFDHQAVVDCHKVACETLRLNKRKRLKYVRDWNIVHSDIVDFDLTDYAGVDLIAGGPPCQPFSQGGKRDGHSDQRNMFPEFIQAVRHCNPKAFIIENVTGLRGPKFLNYFNYLLHQLRFPNVQRKKGERWVEHRSRLERLYTSGKYRDSQYNVIFQSLNAADFGVSQRRERVFIVGVLADLGIEYSFPVPTHTRDALLFDQWVTGDYWDRHEISKRKRPEPPCELKKILGKVKNQPLSQPWRTVRDAISSLPQVGIGRRSHQVHNHFLNSGARSYKGHEGSSLDAPAKTLKAGQNGVPGGENTVRLDDGSVRYFSVRECARLQAFPDSWEFDGSWCGCMRQIGNAVPVTLGEAVALPLAVALQFIL